MPREHQPNPPNEDWPRTVGIESLCQGDVLVFLYRHQSSLTSADQIARLLGYETGPVMAALDHLEHLELLDRSRINGGTRFYQFTAPADSSHGGSLGRLMTLLDSRAGRLLVARQLPGVSSPPPRSEHSPLRMEVGATWLKAI